MKIVNKITILLLFITNTIVMAQTPGFNYQALILGEQQIQVPGTDITNTNAPLLSEQIILRFTIINENKIEYVEEHTLTTDEFGMISLIVGEGTPTSFQFSDINWDGKLKFLKVELNILSNDVGFLFLDNQKILYVPQPISTAVGNGNIQIVNAITELVPPHNLGDVVWIKNYGINDNTTLIIWDGNNWEPVNEDYDPVNEIGLIIVQDNLEREEKLPNPIAGDRVWNKECKCLQIFDDSNWITVTAKATNGLSLDNNVIKLGGKLIEPTKIEVDAINSLAIEGLQNSTEDDVQIITIDKNTGILKQKTLDSLSPEVEEVILFANDGQIEFSTPLNILNKNNINVYRNGINISFTLIDNTTIKLEPEAICYKNDKIRIVQLK